MKEVLPEYGWGIDMAEGSGYNKTGYIVLFPRANPKCGDVVK